jgi:ATP-dependent Clp protease ATP-binding subunit ClpC
VVKVLARQRLNRAFAAEAQVVSWASDTSTMFERYTEPARRAVSFARGEVTKLGGYQITPEHLLLGVLRAVPGVTGTIFAPAQIDASALQNEIRMRCMRSDTVPATFDIPFSEEAKRILYRAAVEADALGHDSIGPEHLVVAMLFEGTSAAADILNDQGIVVEDVRRELAKPRSA